MTVSDRDAASLLEFALSLADAADPIALEAFRGELAVSTKPDATLVTETDRAIERMLRDRIERAFPSHEILGEEYGGATGGSATTWVLDPIDATHNFVRGVAVFATLVAVVREATPVVGVVSAPAMGLRWHAAAGSGAFRRDGRGTRPIAVSPIDRIERAQICYSSLRALARAGFRDAMDTLCERAWRARGYSDFWGHMLVAQGSAEAMLECGVKPWDLAACAAIVTEAGGSMTDFAGNPTWEDPLALTSNGVCSEEILAVLSPP